MAVDASETEPNRFRSGQHTGLEKTQSSLIAFGREVCGDLAAGLRREWLVTNGIGGYASGTLSGIATRRYHGLLVAALEPPVERTVLIGGFVEWAVYDGKRYPLSAQEYGDGIVDPHGYVHLESFRLEGTLPVWTYALADALLERRLWMDPVSNTTRLTYQLLRGSSDIVLELTPLVTYRSFHALTSDQGWRPDVIPHDAGVTIRAFEGALPFHLLTNEALFVIGGDWYWNVRHREETACGLDDRSDLFAPGVFHGSLHTDEVLALALTTEDPSTLMTASRSLTKEQDRQRGLLAKAHAPSTDPILQQFVLAADQFLVERVIPGESTGTTVIAGYHWFNDWGRDTMISLPGLTLATGRESDAANILRTFARYVADGLLPNNFPDRSGTVPGYNTVDATLWYVLAVHAYYRATGDASLVDDLLPTLRDIAACHISGTRYGIGVDPADGLLRAGEPGVQLTWMDAKIGDWVVTPRTGKPVEINALWYNALRILSEFVTERDPRAASDLVAAAEQARAAFRARFRRDDLEHLADVVDGPDGDDWTIRPNQIFAVSLPFPLLEKDEGRQVLNAVGRNLLTSYGLRSLAPGDPAYKGNYDGDQFHRDGVYHQGPVWTWLIGPYVEAYLKLTGDRAGARRVLEPFVHHLRDAGLGSVSEILEGDAPHLPRGCIAQAWGVAEALRAWRLTQQ
jgi:predicted glycogen debranching enzyme